MPYITDKINLLSDTREDVNSEYVTGTKVIIIIVGIFSSGVRGLCGGSYDPSLRLRGYAYT